MFNNFYTAVGKFVSENWSSFWAVLAFISLGGFVGDHFGWVFSLVVPAWFLFVGWGLAKSFDRKNKNKKLP